MSAVVKYRCVYKFIHYDIVQQIYLWTNILMQYYIDRVWHFYPLKSHKVYFCLQSFIALHMESNALLYDLDLTKLIWL